MKWVLIIIGIIVVLIAVVFVVGKLLPEKHQTVVKRDFKTSRSLLWKTLRAFDQYTVWRSTLKQLDVIDDKSWVELDKRGDKITFGIIEEVPSEKLVTKILDKDLPFGGQWVFEISATEGETCTLQITENGEIYNPIFRFVGHFFLDQSATINQYMTDLEGAVSSSQ